MFMNDSKRMGRTTAFLADKVTKVAKFTRPESGSAPHPRQAGTLTGPHRPAQSHTVRHIRTETGKQTGTHRNAGKQADRQEGWQTDTQTRRQTHPVKCRSRGAV